MAQGRDPAEDEITASPDTIVAPATPPGESAVSVVRLSGARAVEIVRSLVDAEPEPRRAAVARLLDRGRTLDRAVVTWFKAPASYTGEDLVEISTHGSPFVRSRLLELCREAGARTADPGEFTLRAFLNGKLDLAQAEAVADLVRARTGQAHRAAVSMLEGGVSSRVRTLRDRLLSLLARVEVQLDHPDEDVPPLDAEAAALEAAEVRRAVEAWLSAQAPGGVFEDGLRVAIVGSPNAGKSSLLNALLGRDRAIVLDEPGTTRDVLEERAELGGAPVLLVDTAGLREGRLDPAEAEGQRRTRRAIEAADLCLVVLDRSKALGPADKLALEEVVRRGKRRIGVLNKSDLPKRLEFDGLEVSALRGTGLDALRSELRREADAALPGDETSAANGRQREALASAASALAEAERIFRARREELAAVHVREALAALGLLVGGGESADVLRTIFQNFCIGK